MELNRTASRITFLSTLSLRRATARWKEDKYITLISIHALLAESDYDGLIASANFCNFYPRSPCGERLNGGVPSSCFVNFYPRSPCGERLIRQPKPTGNNKFLSTLSLRRATVVALLATGRAGYFYPRSPCGERPLEIGKNLTDRKNFYPRSPCGERRCK